MWACDLMMKVDYSPRRWIEVDASSDIGAVVTATAPSLEAGSDPREVDPARELEVDPKKKARIVRTAAERQCDLGDAEACALEDRAAGILERGNGIPSERQILVRTRLCLAGQSDACLQLSVPLPDVGSDARREAFFAMQGCRLGNADACARAGFNYDNAEGRGVTASRSRAAELYRQA